MKQQFPALLGINESRNIWYEQGKLFSSLMKLLISWILWPIPCGTAGLVWFLPYRVPKNLALFPKKKKNPQMDKIKPKPLRLYLPELLEFVDLLGCDLPGPELLLLWGNLHQPREEAAVLDQGLPLGTVPVDVLQAALAGTGLPAQPKHSQDCDIWQEGGKGCWGGGNGAGVLLKLLKNQKNSTKTQPGIVSFDGSEGKSGVLLKLLKDQKNPNKTAPVCWGNPFFSSYFSIELWLGCFQDWKCI